MGGDAAGGMGGGKNDLGLSELAADGLLLVDIVHRSCRRSLRDVPATKIPIPQFRLRVRAASRL